MQVRLMNTTSPQFTAGDFEKIKASSEAREKLTEEARKATQALARMRSERSKKAARTRAAKKKAAQAEGTNQQLRPHRIRELEYNRRWKKDYTPRTDNHLDPLLLFKSRNNSQGLSAGNTVGETQIDVFTPSID